MYVPVVKIQQIYTTHVLCISVVKMSLAICCHDPKCRLSTSLLCVCVFFLLRYDINMCLAGFPGVLTPTSETLWIYTVHTPSYVRTYTTRMYVGTDTRCMWVLIRAARGTYQSVPLIAPHKLGNILWAQSTRTRRREANGISNDQCAVFNICVFALEDERML